MEFRRVLFRSADRRRIGAPYLFVRAEALDDEVDRPFLQVQAAVGQQALEQAGPRSVVGRHRNPDFFIGESGQGFAAFHSVMRTRSPVPRSFRTASSGFTEPRCPPNSA